MTRPLDSPDGTNTRHGPESPNQSPPTIPDFSRPRSDTRARSSSAPPRMISDFMRRQQQSRETENGLNSMRGRDLASPSRIPIDTPGSEQSSGQRIRDANGRLERSFSVPARMVPDTSDHHYIQPPFEIFKQSLLNSRSQGTPMKELYEQMEETIHAFLRTEKTWIQAIRNPEERVMGWETPIFEEGASPPETFWREQFEKLGEEPEWINWDEMLTKISQSESLSSVGQIVEAIELLTEVRDSKLSSLDDVKKKIMEHKDRERTENIENARYYTSQYNDIHITYLAKVLDTLSQLQKNSFSRSNDPINAFHEQHRQLSSEHS